MIGPLDFHATACMAPGYADFDLTLSHDFILRPDKKNSPRPTVALNGFNVLKHTNYVSYVGVLGSPFSTSP